MTNEEIIRTLEALAQYKANLLGEQVRGMDNSEKLNKCDELIGIFTKMLGWDVKVSPSTARGGVHIAQKLGLIFVRIDNCFLGNISI